MIHDLDRTIEDLLVQKVPIDTELVPITFEMPTKEWAAAVSKPTVNICLYDLRENNELRSNERYLSRDGAAGSETRDPVRIDLTYFMSVWTPVASPQVEDEHTLLGTILPVLLKYPVLPAEVLYGAMAAQLYPLRAWIAKPDRTPNAWDFWGGFDGRMKAGISYVVTVALSPYDSETVGLATEKIIKIGLSSS
jgi:hypothetical protein